MRRFLFAGMSGSGIRLFATAPIQSAGGTLTAPGGGQPMPVEAAGTATGPLGLCLVPRRDGADQPPGWQLRGTPGDMGYCADRLDGWALPNLDTFFLRTRRADGAGTCWLDLVTAAHGRYLPVAGARLVLGGLFALHRGAGAVEITILDAGRQVLAEHRVALSADFKGGRIPGRHQGVDEVLDLPAEAAWATLSLALACAPDARDAFLFASALRFGCIGAKEPRAATLVHAGVSALDAILAAPADQLHQALLPLPARPRPGPLTAQLSLRFGEAQVELVEQTVEPPAGGMLAGLSRLAARRVEGWARDLYQPGQAPLLSLLADDMVVWTGSAGATADAAGRHPVRIDLSGVVIPPGAQILTLSAPGLAEPLASLSLPLSDRFDGAVTVVRRGRDRIRVEGWLVDSLGTAPTLPVALHWQGRPVLTVLAETGPARPSVPHPSLPPLAVGFDLSAPLAGRVEAGDLTVQVGDGLLSLPVPAITEDEEEGPAADAADRTAPVPGIRSAFALAAGAGQRPVVGRVQEADERGVRGWALDPDDPDTPLVLDLLLDGHRVATVFNENYTKAPQDAGQKAGFFGFHFHIPPQWALPGRVTFQVQVRGAAQPLEGAAGTLEFYGGRRVLPSLLSATEPHVYRPPAGLDRPARTPRIALIVLNLDGADLLRAFLASLHRHETWPAVEVLVVDHGSVDDSAAVVAAWADRLNIRFLARQRNYSFSQSNNWAAALTDADICIFANNDLVFCMPVLDRVAATLADPAVGLVGVKLLDWPAGEDERSPPLVQHLGVHYLQGLSPRVALPVETRFHPEMRAVLHADHRVPTATGAFLACRRSEFLDAGGLSEDYFYGYEDVDLCLETVFGGRHIVNLNGVAVYHHRGYSRKKAGSWNGDNMDRNRVALTERTGYRLRRAMRAGLFGEPGFWTAAPLTIGFMVREARPNTAADEFYRAFQLAEEIRRHLPATIVFVDRASNWRQLDRLDMVVVMHPHAWPGAIGGLQQHAMKVLWADGGRPKMDPVDLAGFHLILTSDESLAAAADGKHLFMPPLAAVQRFSRAAFSEKQAVDFLVVSRYHKSFDGLNPADLPGTVAVHGSGWESGSPWAPLVRGGRSYDDLPGIFTSARLLIDWMPADEAGLRDLGEQVPNAILAGCLPVTNAVVQARTLFGDALPSFRTVAELRLLLDRFSRDEALRRRTVARLQQMVRDRCDAADGARRLVARLRDLAVRQFRLSINVDVKRGALRPAMLETLRLALGLAAALSDLGQAVRVNLADQWAQPDGLDDDAVITLRDTTPFLPQPHQINLALTFSAGTEIGPAEARLYDRIIGPVAAAAGAPGATDIPLLVTDTRVYTPDGPTLLGAVDVLLVGFAGDRPAPLAALSALGCRLCDLPEKPVGIKPDSDSMTETVQRLDEARAGWFRSARLVLFRAGADQPDPWHIPRGALDALACGTPCAVLLAEDGAMDLPAEAADLPLTRVRTAEELTALWQAGPPHAALPMHGRSYHDMAAALLRTITGIDQDRRRPAAGAPHGDGGA